jgi:hypothetical protein
MLSAYPQISLVHPTAHKDQIRIQGFGKGKQSIIIELLPFVHFDLLFCERKGSLLIYGPTDKMNADGVFQDQLLQACHHVWRSLCVEEQDLLLSRSHRQQRCADRMIGVRSLPLTITVTLREGSTLLIYS